MPRVNLCKLYCASSQLIISHSVILYKNLVDEIEVKTQPQKQSYLCDVFCSLHQNFEILHVCVNLMNFYLCSCWF